MNFFTYAFELRFVPISRALRYAVNMHVMQNLLNIISSHVRFVYSGADDKVFGQLAKCPDSKKHPHAARWFRHIQSWKDGGDGSAAAKKGREIGQGHCIPESRGDPAVST